MNADLQQDQQRADYIAGLRKLADLLETQPHLRLPLVETFSPFCKTKEELHDWLAVLPGQKSKSLNAGNDAGTHMIVKAPPGTFGPFGLAVWIERDQVCRRVVTGTETVDLPAVEAQPARTETREIIEWVCEPVLSEQVPA